MINNFIWHYYNSSILYQNNKCNQQPSILLMVTMMRFMMEGNVCLLCCSWQPWWHHRWYYTCDSFLDCDWWSGYSERGILWLRFMFVRVENELEVFLLIFRHHLQMIYGAGWTNFLTIFWGKCWFREGSNNKVSHYYIITAWCHHNLCHFALYNPLITNSLNLIAKVTDLLKRDQTLCEEPSSFELYLFVYVFAAE